MLVCLSQLDPTLPILLIKPSFSITQFLWRLYEAFGSFYTDAFALVRTKCQRQDDDMRGKLEDIGADNRGRRR